MATWQIREPVPIDWEIRQPDPAKITACTLDDGRFRQTAGHAPLPGVTPAIWPWYLQRLDRKLTRGAAPSWPTASGTPATTSSSSGTGPAGRWHIIEAFGAGRRFLLDRTFHVTRFGDTGFTMEARRPGHAAAVIDERWQPEPAGLAWTVEMTVGSAAPGLRAVTKRVARHRMALLQRRRQHNVEEASNLPHFLPSCTPGGRLK
jgi:hypothetical protein